MATPSIDIIREKFKGHKYFPFFRDFTGNQNRHWVDDAVALGLCSSKLSHVTSKVRGTFIMGGLLQTGMTLTSYA